MRSIVLSLSLLLGTAIPTISNASFAKELLACEWTSDEYLLLRASLPRSGTGYYYIESVTADGKQEVARFEDNQMQLLHSGIGGTSYTPLSSVYFLNDGHRQFLAHFFADESGLSGQGMWFISLPGYRVEETRPVSCTACEMENNYCRDLFGAT